MLTELHAGINVLIDAAASDIGHSAETITDFSLRFHPEIGTLDQLLRSLALYSYIFSVRVEFQVQDGEGGAWLNPHGLVDVSWERDPSLSLSHLDIETTDLYEELDEWLLQAEAPLSFDMLTNRLYGLHQKGASVEVTLGVFIDKERLVEDLAWPANIRVHLYLLSEKFFELLSSRNLSTLVQQLAPAPQEASIILLGDATGSAKGPNLQCIGGASWSTIDDSFFQIKSINRDRVKEALNFRRQECYWEVAPPFLTPYHVEIENIDLNRDDIIDSFAKLNESLSVAYLADRVKSDSTNFACEFKGYKNVEVIVSQAHGSTVPGSIYRLFKWAYENSSSDKLGIARQIISLQLEDDASNNYRILSDKADAIRETAESNFRLYLQRGVELYFDKRLKVSEFLRSFSEEVGASVSTLTSELISNLYKTVGVVVGVVIAALVDPDQVPTVAFLTSLLYLVYIIFILIYMLPSAQSRFGNKVKDYEHSVSELRDVLTDKEITKLEGDAFSRAKRMFLIYFWVTAGLYIILGVLAYLMMRFFWILM